MFPLQPGRRHKWAQRKHRHLRIAGADYRDWLLDPEIARLRSEWIKTFKEWDRTSDRSPEVMLTDEQRLKSRRYYDAEAAYFPRYRALMEEPH